MLQGEQMHLWGQLAQSSRSAPRRRGRVVQLVGETCGELAQGDHLLLLDALAPAHFLLESGLHHLQVVRLAPLFRDLAVGYTMDVDSRITRLLTGRVGAQVLAPVDAGTREPARHHVALGDLILDGEAGVGEHGEHVGERALVVLAARLLARQEAAVDEIFGHQLVERFHVAPRLRFQESTSEGLVLFGHRFLPRCRCFAVQAYHPTKPNKPHYASGTSPE